MVRYSAVKCVINAWLKIRWCFRHHVTQSQRVQSRTRQIYSLWRWLLTTTHIPIRDEQPNFSLFLNLYMTSVIIAFPRTLVIVWLRHTLVWTCERGKHSCAMSFINEKEALAAQQQQQNTAGLFVWWAGGQQYVVVCCAGGKCDGQVLHEKVDTLLFLLPSIPTGSTVPWGLFSNLHRRCCAAVMLFRSGVDVCYASRSMAPL